jgi:hypothetical protein
MLNRRDFINSSALSAAALFIKPGYFSDPALIEKLAFNFSLPKLLDTDFRAAISMLGKMGYRRGRALWPLSL